MTDSIFISIDYLKRNSSIQQNVDGDTIRPYIVLAMDKYILPNVGTALYNRLITDVQNNSLSGNYLTLMQTYIQPTLVWYVQYEGMENFASFISNKGVENKHSENSEVAPEERINKLEDKALKNGMYYSERLIRYLRQNDTLFPELLNQPSGCDTIFPVSTQFFSGIHIPNGRFGYPRDFDFGFNNDTF